MKKETILSLALFVILINLTLILASNPFEDIFSSRFETGVMGLMITLLPAIFLLFLTYISLRRANRTLMSIQLLLWYVFTIYMCFRALAYLDPYLNLGFTPKVIINFFTTDNVPFNAAEKYWFQMSIYVNAIIGLIMSFGNGMLRKILIKKARRVVYVNDFQI